MKVKRNHTVRKHQNQPRFHKPQSLTTGLRMRSALRAGRRMGFTRK